YGGQVSLLCDLQSTRFGTVGDHDSDFRGDRASGHAIGDGFEVGAAPRKENAQTLHRYTTRGPRRFCGTTWPAAKYGWSSLRSSFSARRTWARGTARSMPMPRLNVRR